MSAGNNFMQMQFKGQSFLSFNIIFQSNFENNIMPDPCAILLMSQIILYCTFSIQCKKKKLTDSTNNFSFMPVKLTEVKLN